MPKITSQWTRNIKRETFVKTSSLILVQKLPKQAKMILTVCLRANFTFNCHSASAKSHIIYTITQQPKPIKYKTDQSSQGLYHLLYSCSFLSLLSNCVPISCYKTMKTHTNAHQKYPANCRFFYFLLVSVINQVSPPNS